MYFSNYSFTKNLICSMYKYFVEQSNIHGRNKKRYAYKGCIDSIFTTQEKISSSAYFYFRHRFGLFFFFSRYFTTHSLHLQHRTYCPIGKKNRWYTSSKQNIFAEDFGICRANYNIATSSAIIIKYFNYFFLK